MGTRQLIIVAVVAALGLGCAANDLKTRKENAWDRVPQALPDGEYIYNPSLPTLSTLPDPTWAGYSSAPNAYGHPFRLPGFALYPLGVALDYALVRPFYMLGGLAPEWFGLSTDDAQLYQSHMPELTTSRDAPRHRFE
ncbi:MAG TPA: hypothetical protein VHF87_14430 [Methylomirabilota bacterium]|jgi:hypothetical protein|nr:hypothetical protein [Methylomirabilota bacterium]